MYDYITENVLIVNLIINNSIIYLQPNLNRYLIQAFLKVGLLK